MELDEITAAMQVYQNERKAQGGSQMVSWFGQGNMFSYLRDPNNAPIPPAKEAYVNVYPGVCEGQMVFFVISGCNDIQNNTNIADDVQVCSIATGVPSKTSTGGLPTKEALARIALWNDTYPAWIKANIGTDNSIFSAFAIPQNDTYSGTNHESFLALVADTGAAGGATADLIIENKDQSTIVYMDTVKICPPLCSNDYLLTLVQT